VHIFNANRLSPFILPDGLTLWGAAHCAPAGTQNFLDDFRVDRGGIHIGLFHGSEMSRLAAQGANKFPHAPFRAEEIERVGLHHVFLGHYHRRRADKRYTYPGNPHPLSFGEEGNRGAVIATIFADGTVQREWRSVANCSLHDLQVDITGSISREDIKERIRHSVSSLSYDFDPGFHRVNGSLESGVFIKSILIQHYGLPAIFQIRKVSGFMPKSTLLKNLEVRHNASAVC
jgi:exonuclease SbcD